MRILLFEWLIGGGLLADDLTPPANFDFSDIVARVANDESALHPRQQSYHSELESLLVQGSSMAWALAQDFLAAGCHVTFPFDPRLEILQSTLGHDKLDCIYPRVKLGDFDSLIQQLKRWSLDVDAVLLIAPESDHRLAKLAHCIERAKLISPSAEFIDAVVDKFQLSQRFGNTSNVQVPCSYLPAEFVQRVESGNVTWPIVVKKRVGAGSESMTLLESPNAFRKLPNRDQLLGSENFFFQQFIAGKPVSVSAVVSPDGKAHFFPPTGQRFDAAPFGNYVGAEFPLPSSWTEASHRIASHVVEILNPNGYFGIDMIIPAPHGETPETNGSGAFRPVLLEINPRMTMSYLTLRQTVPENPAIWMIPRG